MSNSTYPVLVESFAARLNECLMGESVRSFAKRTNLSETAVRKYVNGESTPNVERLVAIAEGAGVSVEWLATGKKDNPHKQPVDTEVSAVEDEFALIPGYNVQVSAGHGCITGKDSTPTRYLAFRRKWLKWKKFNAQDLTVVWAKGDSMHPTISDNDTLVVHLGRKEPKDGYIYVFRNGDELFVKRFQDGLGSWKLISDNPIYDKLEIAKEDQHQFEVIGQVVHLAKDIAD